MPDYERFKYALEHIDSTQWRLFEQLANVFCADEFPSLRPMAALEGDGGLDATLFQPENNEEVVLQFSIRKDWQAKVTETCRRLRQTTPDSKVLIYVTNQEVGPRGIGTKKTVRESRGIYLDIWDREWFLTRRNQSAAVTAEADEFITKISGPALKGDSREGRLGQALEDLDARAAFVHLGLQWQDETREKGLTKLCFEAVVRAILRDTSSDNRMTRREIKDKIARILPAQHAESRETQIDGALKRLSKVHIRHWGKTDDFCLTYKERQRLTTRLSLIESLDSDLRLELRKMANRYFNETANAATDEILSESVERCRSVIERVLLERGEVFAEAVTKDRGPGIRFEDVEALVYSDVTNNPSGPVVDPHIIAATVLSLMSDPPEGVRAYLRSLADTYTLFAFMRETPDVQSAVTKIFAEGDIWLDTSVALPLLAEDLLEADFRAHTMLMRAAREAGLKLFVTDGVIEELAAHINRSRGYHNAANRGTEYGPEPFLLTCYKLSGRPLKEFGNWLQIFAGNSRPEDDIADYLEDLSGIEVLGLNRYLEEADSKYVAAVGEIWHQARDRRDERSTKDGLPPMDAGTRARLVAHDVENYVGIQMRRIERNERRSPFGYKSWWLTLDKTAFRVHQTLDDRKDISENPASPSLSTDFMLQYLTIGPVRARLSKKTEEALPLMLNMTVLDAVPQDLLDLSEELRNELDGLPPHVVRRKIRDTLDEARMLLGVQARAGEQGLSQEVKTRLIRTARSR